MCSPSNLCVFLPDPDNAFRKSMVFNILSREGDSVSIPCLATDPSILDLHLETCPGGPLPPGLQYKAGLEMGIVILDTQKAFEGCYVCSGRLGHAPVRSHNYDLIVRPGRILLTPLLFVFIRHLSYYSGYNFQWIYWTHKHTNSAFRKYCWNSRIRSV